MSLKASNIMSSDLIVFSENCLLSVFMARGTFYILDVIIPVLVGCLYTTVPDLRV